jgi:hypothetical protein
MLIERLKAGAKVAPALSLVLYYLFILMDIYTTFIATPDLKYEGNWLVRKFNLGWNHILIKDFLILIIMTMSLFIASDFFHRYFHHGTSGKRNLKLFQSKKFLLSFIGFGAFYSHLIYTFFVIINNYLGFIYINNIENIFSNISTFYIIKTMLENPHFQFYIQLLVSIPGYIVAWVLIVGKFKKTTENYLLSRNVEKKRLWL